MPELPTNDHPQDELSDFEPGEMDALIAEGEQSGPSFDGETVLAELRALRDTQSGHSR